MGRRAWGEGGISGETSEAALQGWSTPSLRVEAPRQQPAGWRSRRKARAAPQGSGLQGPECGARFDSKCSGEPLKGAKENGDMMRPARVNNGSGYHVKDGSAVGASVEHGIREEVVQ